MPQSSTITKYNHHAVANFCMVLLLSLSQFEKSNSLVIPNELPSILSLVYSNIPPIKKGTDSRIGFGFRLGEHADFQVLLELGPQKETRAIGEQDDADGSSFSKRQVNKKQQLRAQHKMTSTESSAAAWLEKWSDDISTSKKQTKKPIANKPLSIPTMSQLPEQTLRQLQMLYKMATKPQTIVTSTKNTSDAGEIDVTNNLQQRLKGFNTPANVEELQVLSRIPTRKTKAEITKELMDVNLEE